MKVITYKSHYDINDKKNQMKKIFYTGTEWKGFESPEKPSHLDPNHYTSVSEYQKAYAAARAAALPIVNPEVIGFTPEGKVYFTTWKSKNIGADGVDYNWPGTWEVEPAHWNMKEEWIQAGIVLSLPAKETGLKEGDAGYKYFTCPTCNGDGRISQDQERKETGKTAEEFNLPAAAVFQLQMIALADDEMVKEARCSRRIQVYCKAHL